MVIQNTSGKTQLVEEDQPSLEPSKNMNRPAPINSKTNEGDKDESISWTNNNSVHNLDTNNKYVQRTIAYFLRKALRREESDVKDPSDEYDWQTQSEIGFKNLTECRTNDLEHRKIILLVFA
ncbi:hypothetical protein WA026_019357 [Henosepilachna vigintioctopunctata]|uniref:Uncharacterized protein n=1 Tax=Henosepilachna vigintioctopunctata TaxID=420089 RepID=A0AAW1UCN1_9CUCU